MSTNFCPQYISFKMNGLTVKLDNLTIHNNSNSKWVRFCGTPCSKFSFFVVGITKYLVRNGYSIQNKLGLSWAKLSSSWDLTSLQLICIEWLENWSYCTQ